MGNYAQARTAARSARDKRASRYKAGGNVKSDKAQDKKMILSAFRQHENAEHGGKHESIKLKKGGATKARADRKARGGPAKGKGHHPSVNVVVATPPAGAGAPPPPPQKVPVPVPVPMRPPMGAGPGGPPMGGPPMGGPGLPPPGGMPMRPPMAAKGGRIRRASGGKVPHMDAGAGGGKGRMEKIKVYGKAAPKKRGGRA